MNRSHEQRQDVDRHGIPNYEMQGGQSRDFHEENARNRELRDRNRSSSGAAQPYYQQQADASRQHAMHDLDADYLRWRDEQARRVDEVYARWRAEHYSKFSAEFSHWRERRSMRDTDVDDRPQNARAKK